jgi:hypothetical protein
MIVKPGQIVRIVLTDQEGVCTEIDDLMKFYLVSGQNEVFLKDRTFPAWTVFVDGVLVADSTKHDSIDITMHGANLDHCPFIEIVIEIVQGENHPLRAHKMLVESVRGTPSSEPSIMADNPFLGNAGVSKETRCKSEEND